MITVAEYFNNKREQASPTHIANANELLHCVNGLLNEYQQTTGKVLRLSPATNSLVSGNHNGDGGFRLFNSATGSAKSSHKQAMAVDVYDPLGEIDAWVNDSMLVKYSLYREHPSATIHWCHLTTRPPGSGNRTFMP